MVRNSISVMAMVLVAAGALVYMHSVGLSVSDNIGVRNAELRVAHANGLVSGSRVLYRGVAVGQVTSVETSLDGVTVKWNYKNEYRIPSSSQFRVDNLSALGESYLGVIPAAEDGDSTLPEGAVLAASSITVPTTFDELSARLVRILGQLHTDKIDDIVNEMNIALPADQTVITNLNHAGVLLESAIVSSRMPFTQLLDAFQTLVARGADISDALSASGRPIGELGEQITNFLDWCTRFVIQDNLPTELIDGAGPFLENLQVFLDKAAPDLKVLGDAALPAIAPTAARLKTVDLSQLMRTAMAMAGEGDGIALHVGPAPAN